MAASVTKPSCPFSMPLLLSLSIAGCAGSQSPLATVPHADLERFTGDWYVIAKIPAFVEKGAHDTVASYELNSDGGILTAFVFRKDGVEGKKEKHHPTVFVTDIESNAVWGARFVWPIKADYRIVYPSDDYSQTVIARNKRGFVWVMARIPSISESDKLELIGPIVSTGYDMTNLQQVPQRW